MVIIVQVARDTSQKPCLLPGCHKFVFKGVRGGEDAPVELELQTSTLAATVLLRNAYGHDQHGTAQCSPSPIDGVKTRPGAGESRSRSGLQHAEAGHRPAPKAAPRQTAARLRSGLDSDVCVASNTTFMVGSSQYTKVVAPDGRKRRIRQRVHPPHERAARGSSPGSGGGVQLEVSPFMLYQAPDSCNYWDGATSPKQNILSSQQHATVGSGHAADGGPMDRAASGLLSPMGSTRRLSLLADCVDDLFAET